MRTPKIITTLTDISTSYVDRLHSYGSVPSSAEHSQRSSRFPTPSPESRSVTISDSHTQELVGSPLIVKTPTDNGTAVPTEQTPLTQEPLLTRSIQRAQTFSYGSRSENQPSEPGSRFFYGHHRYESRGSHEDHRNRNLRIAAPVIYSPTEEEPAKKHANQSSGHGHGTDQNFGSDDPASDDEECEADGEHSHQQAKVGRKRQVVGILVSVSLVMRFTRSLLRPS
jgi:hypothetical protein